MSFTQQRDYLFHIYSNETALCYEDMGIFKRETPRLKRHCSLYWETHDKLFLVSAAKMSRKNEEGMMWIGTLHPVDLWRTDYGLQTASEIDWSPTFTVRGHRSTGHRFFTWKMSLKKVTLPLSSPLLLIFHPSSLSWTSITPECTTRLQFLSSWAFSFFLAPSVYLLCESSLL